MNSVRSLAKRLFGSKVSAMHDEPLESDDVVRARRCLEADRVQLAEDERALAEATEAREAFEGQIAGERAALEEQRVEAEVAYKRGNRGPIEDYEQAHAEFENRRYPLVLAPELARLRALEDDAARRVECIRDAIPRHEEELARLIDARDLDPARQHDRRMVHAKNMYEGLTMFRTGLDALLNEETERNRRADVARTRPHAPLNLPATDMLPILYAINEAFDDKAITALQRLYDIRNILTDERPTHRLVTLFGELLASTAKSAKVSDDFAALREDMPGCPSIGELLLRQRERQAEKSRAVASKTAAHMATLPREANWNLVPPSVRERVYARLGARNLIERRSFVDEREAFEECMREVEREEAERPREMPLPIPVAHPNVRFDSQRRELPNIPGAWEES